MPSVEVTVRSPRPIRNTRGGLAKPNPPIFARHNTLRYCALRVFPHNAAGTDRGAGEGYGSADHTGRAPLARFVPLV
jgi:hypothetical protein